MRRRLVAVVAVLCFVVAMPAFADERAPSPRERISKIVRIIKKMFVPAPQEDLPTPPKP